MDLRRAIVLCCAFDDLVRRLGWRVADTVDIESDICDVVGQLMWEVAEQDRPNVLDCLQCAMMNMHTNNNESDDENIKTFLVKKKKYNGLNLACILLEQMILDNKENNESWMRTICTQFIDLVVQLLIEPQYQEDVRWTLHHLIKMDSEWPIADIYNLTKNGLIIFHDHQNNFYRYLTIIRNFALHPSLNIRSGNELTHANLRSVLSCNDENTWKCIEDEAKEQEMEKSLDQVLRELKEGDVQQREKEVVTKIVNSSRTILKKYDGEFTSRLSQQLELIKNLKLEREDQVQLLSSCLTAITMSLYMCKRFRPSNPQIVSYGLLIARESNTNGRLLEISTGEGKSCVIAMVAATFALLGRTVDIVTSSPVLSQRDAEEWNTFYNCLGVSVNCNVEEQAEGDSGCYLCPIVYGTVETFARDILKTEFLLQDVCHGRSHDIVIVDEVDSMLIDRGLQCTFLSHDHASFGMRHFEPILSLIWMHTSEFIPFYHEGFVLYATEPEVFLVTLSRISHDIDPLQILRLAEEQQGIGIKQGFTAEYQCADIEGRKQLLAILDDGAILRFFQVCNTVSELECRHIFYIILFRFTDVFC